MSTHVLELGEDGDRWMVLGTIDVAAARVAVIDFLRSTLLPGYEDMFAYGVEEALQAAPQVIDECRIYSDPAVDRSFYQSPIGGTPIPAGFDLLGRNAVVLGTRLSDHRTYLSSRKADVEGGRRCGDPHPHYSAMSCGREPGHEGAHSYGIPGDVEIGGHDA